MTVERPDGRRLTVKARNVRPRPIAGTFEMVQAFHGAT